MFRSGNTSALEALGVKGSNLSVALEGDRLVLSGRDGGTVAIPAHAVERLRHFGTEQVHELEGSIAATLEAKIWWSGSPRPVVLTAIAGQGGDYRATILDFAERVAAAHGPGRLQLGPGYATAIVNLLIVVPPCLLLFALLVGVSILDGGWWWLATAVIAPLFLWLGGRNLASRWPRRVRSIEAFRAGLA
ncbi:MAG: hypothetical protein J7500_07765 [Sphingomonas sp.]|uniref:hypothetical protein n=1 Tax=Sphingomonas sp. TaxID=28214 RepID=UPI001B2B4E85|nr:hypothetical protein [Sphingomonas sp.]MBO9622593.1 hypothetical protein [Sphingomonas sp.]